MNKEQKYPPVEIIDWTQFPDYIREDPSKNDEWYIYQFGYLKRYLNKVLEGWGVKDFFEGIPAEKIAIYATTVFTDILVRDLRRSTSKSVYVSAKNIETEEADLRLHLITANKLIEKYRDGEIAKVIVCSLFHENIIMDDLLEMGFELEDIVTLNSILLC